MADSSFSIQRVFKVDKLVHFVMFVAFWDHFQDFCLVLSFEKYSKNAKRHLKTVTIFFTLKNFFKKKIIFDLYHCLWRAGYNLN